MTSKFQREHPYYDFSAFLDSDSDPWPVLNTDLFQPGTGSGFASTILCGITFSHTCENTPTLIKRTTNRTFVLLSLASYRPPQKLPGNYPISHPLYTFHLRAKTTWVKLYNYNFFLILGSTELKTKYAQYEHSYDLNNKILCSYTVPKSIPCIWFLATPPYSFLLD